MKIAVLGAGAMGSLFGGYLSQQNEVYLVDVNQVLVDTINAEGLRIREAEGDRVFHPTALTDTAAIGPMDLVIVFVKAPFTKAAIENNPSIFGNETLVLTMQNGMGHEEVLGQYFPSSRVVIGATKHNCAVLAPGHIHHAGVGEDIIGMTDGATAPIQHIADCFNGCGMPMTVSPNVRRIIWEKLFVNACISVMTGVLQENFGFLLQNASAYGMVERLAREAVAAANAEGMGFDPDGVVANLKAILSSSPNGITSIYADLRDGRKTEVDTISGAVVRSAARTGTPAPSHEFVVQLVHAMECKQTR